MDLELGRMMIDSLELASDDTVVEIGPGLGVLTAEIVKRAVEGITVHAVEIDKRFVDNLKQAYLEDLNVNIVEGNILDWLPKYNPTTSFKVLGSLPYYITSPIVHSVVKMHKRPDLCVFLVQKEVAEKIKSVAPDASYLSTFIQSFYDVEFLGVVPRTKFKPEPKVDGGIIRFKKRTNALILDDQMEKYEGFLHRGFASPRKMLNKVFSREELVASGLDGNLRPQNLSADTWAEVFKTLWNQKTEKKY